MAQSCYIGLGHTAEELKKAKANLASMKSKNKKAAAPLIDEIKAIDPEGLGKLADAVTADLANDVITPQQYKQTITDLHTKAQLDKAQKAVVTAQADVDALKFQLKKAEELDAKAKANLASQKSKSKKTANDLVDALQASGYDEEAIELSLSIDAMVNGTITPQELTEHINILKGLPGSTPPAVVVPPASIVPHTTPTPTGNALPVTPKPPVTVKLTGQQITADINSWSVPDNATFLEYQEAARRAGALADGLVLDHKYTTEFSNQMFREQMRKSPEYRNWYRTTILKTPAEEIAPFTTKDLVTASWVTDAYSNKPMMMITAVTPVQPISTQYVPDIKLAKKQGSMTAIEKETLMNYTEVSDTINSALRTAKGKVGDLPAGLAAPVSTLDELASKFEFHEDAIVWRGVAGSKYKNKQVGQSWTDHAFASTSYSPESAANFAFEQHGGPTKPGVLLEIHVPKGTRYVPTEVTDPLGDAEVLLERGSKYVVKDSYAIADGRVVVVVDLVRDSTIKHAPAINAPSAMLQAPPTALTAPPAPTMPLKTDEWAAAWAAKPKANTVMAKDFPWAKDEWMKANGADYSPYVQDQGAKFPNMTPRQAQVIQAAQAKQLTFPLVDVTLQNAEFVPTQYGGLASVVDKYIKAMPDDKFPRAYLWKGQYHLTNGHHRVMAAYIRGDAVLPVQVIDLDQLAVNDMFPGNLQDLVDGLNPPLASVPSHHLTDAQKAKFGKAPTPAQSAITAPPVGAGPSPASMAPSAPIGGFVVPPTTQQQLTNIQNVLNQHPVFKSADDIKKAAKKAANDKFYAKKKVETAISQAMAGKNLQLELDLTKLYDNIVAGTVVTDAKDVMKLIDDIKINVLTPKVVPTPAVVVPPAAAVPTAVITPTPTAPTSQLVDIHTVDQAIEHAIATTANVGDALKELDTLVPLKELENWGIIKYEELIDAYTNLGYATPPWMFQYPVKIQKGQVSAPNAALAYYNTALPDFQQKVGFSLEDALGVDMSDPIMLKTPTTGYAIPPAAATPPVAGVTATPANLSTPSGVDAQVIHAQYTGGNIDVDAGMWMDVMDTQAINTPHFGPGGMLEELTLVGPEVNGTTQIMKEFHNFVMNPNVITPTTLPTSTKFISSELDVHMPDLDKIVASGKLSGEPTKVFIWKGKYHLAGPNTDIIAAKILNIHEVPVEVLNLDEVYSAATKSFSASPATPVPSAPTNDQIMHDINTKVFSGEMNILIKKANGKPLKKLDIDVIGDITLAKEWGLLKFTSMSDLYKNANLPVPQDITDALKLFNTATASMADVKKALVNYPVTFTKVQTDIGLIKGPKKVLQPTVLPTHSLPPKTSTLTSAETQQVADLEAYLKKVETIGPGMLDDAYAQLNNAKAGNITIVDAHKEAMKVVEAFKLEWQNLHSATYSLMIVGQANYNIPFQLRVNQLRNKIDSQIITLSDAQKALEQLKIDAGSLTPLAYKTNGALASAKSGAKKKINEARMAEKDPAKKLALQKVEEAIANGRIVVYNGSDAKDILAALDYTGWPTKSWTSNVFTGMPSTPVLSDPNYLPPKSMAEIKALLQSTPDAPVSEIIRSTTTMNNVYDTLEDWQIKALDNEIQAIQSGSKYVYSQHTDVQTTEWYSLEGQKMDPAISKQIVAGDYAHGDVIAIRDGNKVIVIQGESVVSSYIAAGKSTVNIKVVELDQIQKLPDMGTVPDYLVHQEQIDDAYKVTGWTNSEIKDAEKWMHGNGQKSHSKDRTITDYAEKDPEFQAALNQAGISKDEFQAFVSEHIHIWNANSSRGAKMTALHLMVAEELQLAPDLFRLTDNFANQIPAGEAILNKRGGIYRMMVRAMYKHTQDEFAAAGITHLSLWRGYGFQEGRSYMPDDFKKYLIGDKFQYTNQSLPLQSWSTSRSTALGFANKQWGYITKSRIEVKHVFATGITGVGTGTNETEFVLMAAPGTVEHEVYHRPDGLRRP